MRAKQTHPLVQLRDRITRFAPVIKQVTISAIGREKVDSARGVVAEEEHEVLALVLEAAGLEAELETELATRLADLRVDGGQRRRQLVRAEVIVRCELQLRSVLRQRVLKRTSFADASSAILALDERID